MEHVEVRIEVKVKKKKVYVLIYLADSDYLIHTYIFGLYDKLTLDGIYVESTQNSRVSDYS